MRRRTAMVGLLATVLGASTRSATFFTLSGPPAAWRNVPIGGGGFVSQMVASSDGTIYMGTDVGGAFRWDAAGQTWVPIDEVIGFSNNANGFGIEAIAVDPSAPSTVWIYVGEYTYSPGNLFKSNDGGNTWVDKTPAGLLGDGNGQQSDKARGNKIAIDPANSN